MVISEGLMVISESFVVVISHGLMVICEIYDGSFLLFCGYFLVFLVISELFISISMGYQWHILFDGISMEYCRISMGDTMGIVCRAALYPSSTCGLGSNPDLMGYNGVLGSEIIQQYRHFAWPH